VMHVHDEIVTEVDQFSEHTLKGLEDLMCEVPPWATGMPIAAEGWEGRRFRKG